MKTLLLLLLVLLWPTFVVSTFSQGEEFTLRLKGQGSYEHPLEDDSRAASLGQQTKEWPNTPKIGGRRLLQTGNGTVMCADVIEELFDETHDAYVLGEEDVLQLIDVTNCIADSATVIVQVSEVTTERPIVISHSVTIIGRPPPGSSEDKVRIQCPDNRTGVFDITNGNVVLENFSIHDCNQESGDSPVVVTGSSTHCSLVDIDFLNNTHSVAEATIRAQNEEDDDFAVSLIRVNLLGNKSPMSGVASFSASTIIQDVKVAENNGRDGILLFSENSNITITSFSAINNTAPVLAIQEKCTLFLSGSIFTGNGQEGESGDGGAINAKNAKATIRGTVFKANRAAFGGAIFAKSLTIDADGTQFIMNRAREGGVGYLEDCNTTFRNGTFIQNSVSNDGGAFRAKNKKLIFLRCNFTENRAENTGGSFFTEDNSLVVWKHSIFRRNHANFGGAARIERSKRMRINSCRFIENEAGNTGGALHFDEANNSNVSHTEFTSNRALYAGGFYNHNTFKLYFRTVTFNNNSAELIGGAGHSDHGEITFENCTAQNNDGLLGGGFFFLNATITATNLTVSNNIASEGGAFKSRMRTNITCCTPEDFNGTNCIPDPTHTYQSHSFGIRVENNRAENGGGAIDLEDSSLNINGGFFNMNSGIEGGAIYAWRYTTQLTVQNTVFLKNKAEVFGGTIFSKALEGGDVTLFFKNATFKKSKALLGGGCQFTSIRVRFEDCEFIKCEANLETGGAIMDTEHGQSIIEISNSKFRENRAQTSGGSIYANNANISISYSSFTNNIAITGDGGGIFATYLPILDLKEVRFEKNEARYGGGLLIKNSKLDVSSCTIIDNSARGDGGGIRLSGSNATMDRLQFEKNVACGAGGGLQLDTTSGIEASELTFSKNSATNGGGLQTDSQSFVRCLECRFDFNNAKQKGGGIDIKILKECRNVQLKRPVFRSNSANYGGGIHVWSKFRNSEDVRCRQKSTADCKKRPLTMFDANFTNNHARRNGSSVHSNERKIISIINSDFGVNGAVLHSDDYSKHKSCFPAVGVEPRNAPPDVSGVVSTYVSGFKVRFVGSSEEVLENGTVRLMEDFVSGSRLPAIDLMPIDQFDQFPAAIDGRFKATLSAESVEGDNDELLKAEVTASQREDGTWRFETSVTERVEVGNYKLRIDFGNDYSLNPISLIVHTRNCTIGEEMYRNEDVAGPYCRTCETDEYSLSSEDVCNRCPENVDCRGKHLFAKAGHWLRSPFHTLPSTCLNRVACSGDSNLIRSDLNSSNLEAGTTEEDVRAENLLDFIKGLEATNPDDLDKEDKQTFSQLSCHEGYEGVLCGDCSLGYGQTSNYKCRKCSDDGVAVIIVLSFLLFTTFIVAVTIKGNSLIDKSSELVEMAEGPRNSSILKGSRIQKFQMTSAVWTDSPSDVIPDIHSTQPDPSSHFDSSERSTTIALDEGTSQQKLTVDKQLLKLRTVKGFGSTSKSNDGESSRSGKRRMYRASGLESRNKRKHQITPAHFAKWKVCELLKSLINFMQAVAVAAIINVEWTREMKTLFQIADVSSGASVEAISNSIYCLSDQWYNRRSFWSSVCGMAGPFAVVLIFVVFYSVQMRKGRKRFSFLFRKVTLSFLALLYFSYLTITKQTLLVFNCIKVHETKLEAETVTTYWAQDTSLECFTSYHFGLFTFAVVFLAVFVIGFPVISAIVLWHFSRKGQLGFTGILYDIMGFMYRGYDSRHCYWESIVMFRKACFSVIAVFSYSLGGATQGLMASLVNVLCLFAHTMVRPYREELSSLNIFEAMSLIFSCITFILSSFFVEGLTSAPVRHFIAVSLILMIVGFVLFMLIFLCYSAVDYLHLIDSRATFGQRFSFFVSWVVSRGYVKYEDGELEEYQGAKKRGPSKSRV